MPRLQHGMRLAFVKPSLLVNRLLNTIAKHNPCPTRPLYSLTHKQAHLAKCQLPQKHSTYVRKLTAIATQHKLTYGLSLSPTRAALQNVPSGLYDLSDLGFLFRSLRCFIWVTTYPFLFLSRNAGKTPCRYVHVQMKRRTTRRSVWNLRMPSWMIRWLVYEDPEFLRG
jgi:hypothetical protein